MKQRKWNALLTVFSFIGGLAGFVAGEIILDRWDGTWPDAVLMGVYFGQFALLTGLSCLLAEIVSPRLNGNNWRLRYARDGFKFLVPATLVLLFAGGALFQWIYGLDFSTRDRPQDYVLLMDRSESMSKTDPDRQSLQAAKDLIGRMYGQKRAAIFTFNEEPQQIFPLTQLDRAGVREDMAARLDAAFSPEGQTNISKALDAVREHIAKERVPGRKVAVILISDGYSEVDFAKVLSPYVQEHIEVHTVGIESSEQEGNRLLQRIAAETGGTFHDANGAAHITDAFGQIYSGERHRLLTGERTGAAAAVGAGFGAGDPLHGLLRIVLITLVGTLLGLSLGIIFDNRYLAKSFSIGGTIAGVIAGIILETGLQDAQFPFIHRAWADIVLAVVLSLSTMMVAVPDSSSAAVTGLRTGLRGRTEQAGSRSGSRENNRVGKQFRR